MNRDDFYLAQLLKEYTWTWLLLGCHKKYNGKKGIEYGIAESSLLKSKKDRVAQVQ